MIEIIYNKEKEAAVGNEEYFCVPRNIRQVGQPSSDCKIYVEDYVYSYLAKDWKDTESKGKMAILLGKSNWKDGTFYIFLKSTIVVEDMEISGEYLSLKDEVWGKIYEEMKEYFPGQEVIGWYLSLPGGGLKVTDMIKRIHLTHFGGNDKVLYLADLEEQDNAFFIYRNGRMEKQAGYYIFYEKNEPMQEYLLEKNPKASVDYTGKPQDRAVNDFRKIIARKREEKEAHDTSKTFHILTVGAAAAVVVLGVMWLQRTSLLNNLLPGSSTDTSMQETLIESVQDDTTASSENVANAVGQNVLEDEMNEILNTSGDVSDGENADGESVDGESMNGESIDRKNDEELDSSNGQTEDASANLAGNNADRIMNSTNDTEAAGTASSVNGSENAGTLNSINGNKTDGIAGNLNSDDNEASAGTSVYDNNTTDTTQQTASTTQFTEYTIREGDTLSAISIRYYGDMSKVAQICKINNMLEEDTIYPGQKILLP